MKNITLIISLLLIFSLNAQDFTSFSGPTGYMRLNAMGNEFEDISFNASKGSYIFVSKNILNAKPWSVVSDYGMDIYTKLDLRYVDINEKIYILTPKLSLLNTKVYSYSQTVLGIVNAGVRPIATTNLSLKLMPGDPSSFSVATLATADVLLQSELSTSKSLNFTASNIKVLQSGNYYFVLQIDASALLAEKSTAMSLAFKYNSVVQSDFVNAVSQNNVQACVAYPNPTVGNIRFAGFSGDIEIINAFGICVMKINNYQEKSIDVSSLAHGLYFAKNSTKLVRFIKE